MTELAVLVPVLNRPQNIVPLVASFLTTHLHDDAVLFFIPSVDDHDEIEEIKKVRAEYYEDFPGWLRPRLATTWPEKINHGVKKVEADWYLCGADDIAFTPGWWEATKELRDDPRIGVIGTNDSATASGNPRVAAGDHTCHPLIRASYIRDAGTVDEPGKAVHDGYLHSFVDDELLLTAKSRNAWAFCRESVVEHLHPWWKPDEVPWDDTYERGSNPEAFAQDRALFAERVKLLGYELR